VSYSATFKLPIVIPLLNVSLRTHYAKKRRLQAQLSGLLRMASHGKRPQTPLQRARVTIERHSVGTPDYDGLVGGAKSLIDVLLVPLVLHGPPGSGLPKLRHSLGLSFVVDDAPTNMEMVFTAVRVKKRTEQCTVVSIEELPAQPAPSP
jgi:hypothetical protein